MKALKFTDAQKAFVIKQGKEGKSRRDFAAWIGLTPSVLIFTESCPGMKDNFREDLIHV